MTNEEWVKSKIEKNKEYYKTADVMIDEQIRLLSGIKKNRSEEEKWELITAVSEAYHVVLIVAKDKKANRLVNTIASFIKENVAI